MTKEGHATIIAVVDVIGIFAIRLKSRYDVFRDELNLMTSVNNLDELRWYEGCYYSWDRDRGILTIFQKRFPDALVITFYVASKHSVRLRAGAR